MATQSQLFNRFLAEVSDLSDELQAACEKYSSLWEETLPYDSQVDKQEALRFSELKQEAERRKDSHKEE